MAQRTIVTMVDDLTGDEATETRSVIYEGKTFSVDLTEEHAKEFDAFVGKYAEAGRRSVPIGRPERVHTPQARRDLSAIREWLRAAGHDVSDRGRISEELMQAWRDGRAAESRQIGNAVAERLLAAKQEEEESGVAETLANRIDVRPVEEPAQASVAEETAPVEEPGSEAPAPPEAVFSAVPEPEKPRRRRKASIIAD